MGRERTKREFLHDYVLARVGAINEPLELGSIDAIIVDGKLAWALIEEAVALFGKEVMDWHMAIHKRDELVKENSDLKERIGELEEELANIFTEGSLLCRWLFNPNNFFQAMASWLRSKK